MLAFVEGYIPLAVLAVLTLTVGGGALLVSHIMGPKRQTRVKELPYECGLDPIQPTARERYSIHFYLVAILFILFDLETVFLFPWAVAFRDGMSGPVKIALLVEVLAFVAVLALGLFYVWKRRGLEWD
jgi:NADH-quinone oxidoreductase subunit A